jgi:hypothetical protein
MCQYSRILFVSAVEWILLHAKRKRSWTMLVRYRFYWCRERNRSCQNAKDVRKTRAFGPALVERRALAVKSDRSVQGPVQLWLFSSNFEHKKVCDKRFWIIQFEEIDFLLFYIYISISFRVYICLCSLYIVELDLWMCANSTSDLARIMNASLGCISGLLIREHYKGLKIVVVS